MDSFRVEVPRRAAPLDPRWDEILDPGHSRIPAFRTPSRCAREPPRLLSSSRRRLTVGSANRSAVPCRLAKRRPDRSCIDAVWLTFDAILFTVGGATHDVAALRQRPRKDLRRSTARRGSLAHLVGSCNHVVDCRPIRELNFFDNISVLIPRHKFAITRSDHVRRVVVLPVLLLALLGT